MKIKSKNAERIILSVVQLKNRERSSNWIDEVVWKEYKIIFKLKIYKKMTKKSVCSTATNHWLLLKNGPTQTPVLINKSQPKWLWNTLTFVIIWRPTCMFTSNRKSREVKADNPHYNLYQPHQPLKVDSFSNQLSILKIYISKSLNHKFKDSLKS